METADPQFIFKNAKLQTWTVSRLWNLLRGNESSRASSVCYYKDRGETEEEDSVLEAYNLSKFSGGQGRANYVQQWQNPEEEKSYDVLNMLQ